MFPVEVDVLIPFHQIDNNLTQAIKSVISSQGIETRIIAVNDTNLKVKPESIGLRNTDILVPSKSNGYIGALSTGVAIATAQNVAFLDSDDLYHPTKLRKQLDLLSASGADLVTCRIAKFSSDASKSVKGYALGDFPDVLTQSELLIFGSYGADSSILINREKLQNTWDKHSNFPPHLADYGWLLATVADLNCQHLAEFLYFYRSHPAQMSRKSNLKQDWKMLHQFWLENLYKNIPRNLEFSSGISTSVTQSIVFPFSFPNLSLRERLDAILLLKKIESGLIHNHPACKKSIQGIIETRISLLEFGINPIHFWGSCKLIWRIMKSMLQSKGIKRR
jgi:glycosyltransferase involved in cell wall biosynthesis